jgi:acyl carrier protein
MGLQLVEFVLDVEDEFHINIRNEDAGELVNIARLSNYVIDRLRERGEPAEYEQIRNRLVELLVSITGIDSREIHEEAHFVYDLGIDAHWNIARAVKRRRRHRPLDDVIESDK